ncbi:MAG TPA: Slp family lipoprotein [Nitrospiraceae bacterium]|nr:Slp family lipoprotein [Nitrospiraceae bacterium]
MRWMRALGVLVLLGMGLLQLPGCASYDVVPDSLEPQIDKSLTFDQVIASPDSYRGRTFVVGGEVLKARRLKDGTQIEVLQLPLDGDQRPVSQRSESQGRLLAMDPLSTDPATLPDGTSVTMVAEVTGVATDRLDEAEYRYPTMAIKHLYVWKEPPDPYRRSRGPVFGVFGGVGFGGYGGTRSGGGVSIGTGF